ncbi:WD repeat-containing protein 44 isoform X2 [Chrysoperla carnea]|uniref:WD repeat-containing protein 44 isoform X2 n=1 Tax=Chrysoperla carnea TaxID=189513 RepID=UPI001D0793F6|nr:WD repeat-containing protein 44 isoform X2 [Chrysoperla carnea]
MSTSSDSDEFYDAEDITPSRISSRVDSHDLKSKSVKHLIRSGSEPCISIGTFSTGQHNQVTNKTAFNKISQNDENPTSSSEIRQTRRKLREIRKKMETDDEDGNDGNISPADSQTSSIEGIYANSGTIQGQSSRTTHPFRIVEQDAVSLQSMNSLGRVGRILSGNTNIMNANRNNNQSMSTISQSSKDSTSESNKDMSQYPSTLTLSAEVLSKIENNDDSNKDVISRVASLPLQEPDVVASAKTSTSANNSLKRDVNTDKNPSMPCPIAPPRRKKKTKMDSTQHTSTTQGPSQGNLYASESVSPLASPASTIESLTREFEHSLDKTHYRHSSLDGDNQTKAGKICRALRREFEHSLDIKSALQGQFVVKPQDEDKSRADGPSSSSQSQTTKEDSITTLKKELLDSRFKYKHNVNSVSSNNIGHSSLGPHRLISNSRGSKQRRRSAGDEDMIKQLNMFVRMRSDSGKPLTDMEILEQVTVLNLDTGERVPLSVAEDKLPQCINPLSLHIMRLTSEYVSTTSLDKEKESDEESVESKQAILPQEIELSRMKKGTAKLRRILGSTVKKTMHKAKSIAHEVSHARHKEDVMDIVDEVNPGEQNIKLKASNSHKGPYEFENTQHVQELSAACSDDDGSPGHVGPIWCMKFSTCGHLLATAGQDRILRVWVVKEAFAHFQAMRNKYNAEKVSPSPSQESLASHHKEESRNFITDDSNEEEKNRHIFMEKPFCTYTGHTSDLLDVSWSKNYFVLSSSMDKTVRLWHITRNECLCCFQHIDFVTAIVFHPRDDRYFLSGSLDGKLRLWNIPDKKVAVWNEVDGQTKLITAANFCQNGKFAVVGSYDGRCIFYTTDQLKYHTQINVRSTRGRNSTGRKISGIEPMPGEDKILVTSNDSRIRLYDLRDLSLSCKYKGYVNVSSQIKANFSHDGKYIVSGSENRDIYVWKTNHDYSKFSSVRRDRNDFWEAIKAHNAVVTCAVFAPNPDSIIKMIERTGDNRGPSEEQEQDPVVEQHTKGCGGHVLVSADFNGCIKVFINKMKPKHSSLPASALA